MVETDKPSSESNRRSLRSVLIHRPMQREFTLITIAIMMFSSVFIAFLIQYTLRQAIADNISSFGRIGAYNVLSDVSFELIARVTLVMFATIVGVGMFAVFFLHRVAGPVYRFHQLFHRINRNEIPQDINLRRKDFFKEVAIELNLLFKLLRKRKDAIHEVESILNTISEQETPQEIRTKVQKIRSIIQVSQKLS